jgi:molybdate transport system substrate-binding protein
MPRPRRLASAAACAAVLIGLASAAAGCASGDPPAGSAPRGAEGSDDLSGELRIFAAASLGAAFDELVAGFERQHPTLDVLPVTYEGSSTLSRQLVEGASADVFASADEKNMDAVVDGGLAQGPRVFAANTLVIAVPRGNPGAISAIEDLAAPDATVVLCAPEVPCGAASDTLLKRSGVHVEPASLEQNVTAVLTKVAAGEADAGLVYVTDARRSRDVEAIEVAGAEDVVNRYPIVALDDAANPGAASAFVAFVLSEEGQAVLRDLGFGPP